MAKRRRIAFTTLHTAPSTSFGQSEREGGDKPQGSLPAEATVRISVPLFQSNDQRYPEFYYPDLVESCRQGREVGPCGDKKDLPDPFNIKEKERQEVEDLGGKRCRKDWIQDLIDMGYGYDESDSFIDNSEVYTEFVPASLDTKYGGFYINMGILECQQVSESEDNYVKEKCSQIAQLRKVFPVDPQVGAMDREMIALWRASTVDLKKKAMAQINAEVKLSQRSV